MEVTSRLDTGGSVILDASGNGAIILRPSNAHQRWLVKNTVVQTNAPATSTVVPTCYVYVGGPTTNNAVDSTYTGNQDASDSVYDVPFGSFLTVQWLGGNAGDRASVSISGDSIQTVGV
jgi:hypothetical protein